MSQWYVKNLSELTGVSVQALHHYDRISLLKPSIREANGYRLYSEHDLLRLQRIIALKFFGFKLDQIKTLLTEQVNMIEHFNLQAQFLDKQVKAMMDASNMLKEVISNCRPNQSISWETIVQLMEGYRMSQQLEHPWIVKFLTPEESAQYVRFEKKLKTQFTEEEKKSFEQDWIDIIKKIQDNIDVDPTSDFGMNIGKECMMLINTLYGKENANLKHSIWEKGYKKGNMEGEHELPPRVVEWLDKAVDSYYRNRIMAIFARVDANNDKTMDKALKQQWQLLLTEMFGNSENLKKDFLKMVETEFQVSKKSKDWVKNQ